MADWGVSGVTLSFPVRLCFEVEVSSALRSVRIWLNSKAACSSGVKAAGGALCAGNSGISVERISLRVSLLVLVGFDPQNQPILFATKEEWQDCLVTMKARDSFFVVINTHVIY